jgi:hypothetical protein
MSMGVRGKRQGRPQGFWWEQPERQLSFSLRWGGAGVGGAVFGRDQFCFGLLYFETGSFCVAQLPSNLLSSYLSLPSAGITDLTAPCLPRYTKLKSKTKHTHLK